MSALPRFVESIAKLLLRDDECDAALGDLAEIFAADVERHGRRRATTALIGEIASLTFHAFAAWIRTDRALSETVLLAAAGTGVASLLTEKPAWFLITESFLMLAFGLIARRHAIRSGGRRFGLVFSGYLVLVAWTFIVVCGIAVMSGDATMILRWAIVAIPTLIAIGVIGAAIVAVLSSPGRSIGLWIVSIPVFTATIQAALGSRIGITMPVKLIFPVSTWGPPALRAWKSLADVAIWAAIAFAISSVARKKSSAKAAGAQG